MDKRIIDASELLSKHASGGSTTDVLDHVNVCNKDFVVCLKFLKLFGIICAPRPITHYYSIATFAIYKVEHISAHPFDL